MQSKFNEQRFCEEYILTLSEVEMDNREKVDGTKHNVVNLKSWLTRQPIVETYKIQPSSIVVFGVEKCNFDLTNKGSEALRCSTSVTKFCEDYIITLSQLIGKRLVKQSTTL